jgi:hypothetical protein
MKKLPKCWSCIYHKELPWDGHYSCQHPEFKPWRENSHLYMVERLADLRTGSGELVLMRDVMKEFNITFGKAGIRQGKVVFPWNFDPHWLDSCLAYVREEGRLNQQIICETCQSKHSDLFCDGSPYPNEHKKIKSGMALRPFKCDFCAAQVDPGDRCFAFTIWSDTSPLPYRPWEDSFIKEGKPDDPAKSTDPNDGKSADAGPGGRDGSQ